MLTGDHPGTASAIARQVGILPLKMDELRKDVAGFLGYDRSPVRQTV